VTRPSRGPVLAIGVVLIVLAVLAGALAVYNVVQPGPMGAGYIVGFLIGLPAVAVGLLGAALVAHARRRPTSESDPAADPRDPLHR
jgi:hypothetical protein